MNQGPPLMSPTRQGIKRSEGAQLASVHQIRRMRQCHYSLSDEANNLSYCKPPSLPIASCIVNITLKFNRWLSSIAAQPPVKFQRDMILNVNLVTL